MDDPNPNSNNELYFPPTSGDEWETVSINSLSWDDDLLEDLYLFLEEHNSRAFIILKNGKIVTEKYWGKNIGNTGDFNENSDWYWASAAKSLTSFLVGQIQEEGLLSIEDASTNYLGAGWTSMELELESQIRVKHHLSMSSGIDYNVLNLNCTDPECLEFKSLPGNEWFYHNATYTLLKDIVEAATNQNYNEVTSSRVGNKIGMNGYWLLTNDLNLYLSNAREMARFGLLMLANGTWQGEEIMKDSVYFNQMITSSQESNPSYGYLWWLNGMDKIIYPGVNFSVPVSFEPNAPEDMYTAAGKDGQFLNVIPSENIIVVRMGEAPDDELVPIEFHNEMWDKLSVIIQ